MKVRREERDFVGAQVTHTLRDKGLGVVTKMYSGRFFVVLWNNGDQLLEMRGQLVLAGYENPTEGGGA